METTGSAIRLKAMKKERPCKHEREFARAVDNLNIMLLDIEWDDYLQRSQFLERDFLVGIDERSSRYLEIRRRVAESIAANSVLRKRPEFESRIYIQELCALGFTDPEREAEFFLLYAHLCGQAGRQNEAIALLTSLIHRFQNAPRRLRDYVVKRAESGIAQFGKDNGGK